MQNKICINVFFNENETTYPVYLSDQKFSDSIDLLLISNEFVSHYVYINNFNRFMFNKTKHTGKKYFCINCLQCFSNEKILNEHKKDCLVINGKQNVKLESGFISFKNYSRQIPVPFKTYGDSVFYRMLIVILVKIFHTQRNIKIIFLVVQRKECC